MKVIVALTAYSGGVPEDSEDLRIQLNAQVPLLGNLGVTGLHHSFHPESKVVAYQCVYHVDYILP